MLSSALVSPGLRAQRTTGPAASAPASLIAWSNLPGRVSLSWPAVAGAERYRLTRSEGRDGPELVVEELPAAAFAFEGAGCDVRSSQSACAYDDVTRAAGRRHVVASGRSYIYRVRVIFGTGAVSPPSPPAPVRVR